MKKQIITVTLNPALDKISQIEHVVPNQKLRCEKPRHEAGGGGINVSRAIRRLGGDSLALFPCGGSNGEIIKNMLADENVRFKATPIQDLTRENLTLFESSTDNQYRFIMPGHHLSQEEWEQTLKEISEHQPQPDFIVLSGSTPPGVPTNYYQRIANLARDLNSKLIVDTSGDSLVAAANAGVYLLKPNMRELRILAQGEIESEAQQKQAARGLIKSGKAKIVIVSLGAGGALLVTKNITEHIRTPTVPIRSKLGAGDSMVAGVVLSLAQGKRILDAIKFGVAAGAAGVMTPGTELCRKEDTDKLYQRLMDQPS